MISCPSVSSMVKERLYILKMRFIKGVEVKVVAVLIFFLWSIPDINAQRIDSLRRTWSNIVISDSYHGWSFFDNKYLIKRYLGKLLLVTEKDSVISQIHPKLIDELFE